MRFWVLGPAAAAVLTAWSAAGCCHHETHGTPAKEAAAAPSPAAPKTPDDASNPNRVSIDNFAFKPQTLTVTVGEKVVWVNHDDVPHTATSNEKPRKFDSGTLDTDDTFSFVFDAPGTYAYFCAVHPHMTGQIVVRPKP